MIPDKNARRSNSLDAELDALVAREVDALALRQVRSSPKTQAPREEEVPASTEHDTEGEMFKFPTHRSRDEPGQPARSESSPDNVIGIRHGGVSGGTGVLAFSAEDEAFIEQAVAFLRKRPNADVIIEEVWHHTVPDRDDDGPDQRLVGKTQMADEPAAPDNGARIEEPIPTTSPDAPLTDDNRVMSLQPSMTKTRTLSGTVAETTLAKSAQPAPPRNKQKRDHGEREKESDN